MTATVPTTAPRTEPGGAPDATGRTGWGTARAVLRVHRTALVVWGVLVAAAAGGLVWLTEVTGPEVRARQEACDRAAQDWCDMDVGLVGYGGPLDLIGLLTAGAFVAVAAFAGGALIGRELDSGTARLAWTQGITPTRWLAAKLAVPALAVTLGLTVEVLVFRWAWSAGRPLTYADWWSGQAFTARGPVTVAYALCALAVGALTGLLLRRALPALGVSVAAVLGLALLLARYRASLWPTVTLTSPTDVPSAPEGSWDVESGVLVHGRRTPDFDLGPCDRTGTSPARCLDDLGVTGSYTRFHPESHFWPLQCVETGIVLGVAVLATAAAFLLLRRRTATTGG